jgi:hypothetical protein
MHLYNGFPFIISAACIAGQGILLDNQSHYVPACWLFQHRHRRDHASHQQAEGEKEREKKFFKSQNATNPAGINLLMDFRTNTASTTEMR